MQLTDEQIDSVWDGLDGPKIINGSDCAEWNKQIRRAFARTLLATHSGGAQEALFYADDEQIAEWRDGKRGAVDIRVISTPHGSCNTPLYAHPRPMTQTDASRHLSNLLARIHRDGGHYEAEHGTDKAVADADDKVAQLNAMTDAARDVLAERQRQVSVEGWTAKHDDLHTDFGAAKAAAVYALHAADTVGVYSHFWPWEPHWWKPSTPRRELVKAGALILAEIERLDRAKGE